MVRKKKVVKSGKIRRQVAVPPEPVSENAIEVESTIGEPESTVADANRAMPVEPVEAPEGANHRETVTQMPLYQSMQPEIVSVLGRVGRYPELKCTLRGTMIAKFSVASEKPYQDASGNWQKKTAWQRIVVWGGAAQGITGQLRTGVQVFVEGKLNIREWTDRQNNPHTTRELYAEELRFVDMSKNQIVRKS
jgi:single-strand DNA-binding protein